MGLHGTLSLGFKGKKSMITVDQGVLGAVYRATRLATPGPALTAVQPRAKATGRTGPHRSPPI